jgi:hypothetical protein
MQPLGEVWTELLVRVGREKHTLKVEVTAQPLYTDPGERSFYSTNDNLPNRILKRNRLDGVFLSQHSVLFGKVLDPKRREATLLQESVQLLKLWED